MRYTRITIFAITLCLVFSSCVYRHSIELVCFGFNPDNFIVIEENDTHGGFHGDGSYRLILDCSENTEKAKELIKDWKPLPLSENLQTLMYGGETDEFYTFGLAEEAHWPVINNGVYKFADRHSESVDPSDDTNIFNRHSYNFSIAAYDLDTNTLYFYACDT